MCRDGCINYTLNPYYTVFIELIPSSLAWARIIIMTPKAQATIASVGKWKDRQQHFCPPKETIQLGNIDKPQSGIRTTILKKKTQFSSKETNCSIKNGQSMLERWLSS